MSGREAPAAPRVAIVGAGFGGLAAAIELQRAGIPYKVFERQEQVGGVWCANTYPGAACDVPSEIYSFSFALKPDWSRRFGSQREIQAYLADVADAEGITPHIRFKTEVVAARWDEDAARWELELGNGERAEFEVLVCATGQLSQPKVPDVPGRSEFAGDQFHSAEWDHSAELAGKRIAVVGSGASAIQLVPAIADTAERVTVIQRSPNWVVPKYDWRTTRLERALMRIPAVARLRHNLMWWWFESRYPIVLRAFDPARKFFEAKARWTIRRHIRDRALADAVTPDYPMGCNRILLSSDWYPTLARPDVDLVPGAVERVTSAGLVTSTGRTIAADIIVWCTGFTPTEYIAPMRVVGRGGRELHEVWRDGPEAYLGIATPGFPNLFMSYGPNTGSLTNTIIFMLERQAAYIRQAVEYLAANRLGGLAVKPDVHERFNRNLQRRLQRTVFTAGCPGWYTTDDGKVTTVWPGSHVGYARATRRFDPAAFEVVPAPARASQPLAHV